jgi:hypothetical protein
MTTFGENRKTMQQWRLAISRSPKLETTPPDQAQTPKQHHFTVFCKIWKTRQRCNCLKEWSGLSESNRHLNLGKVPYYHYTKAAQ